jgi:hypothetical protein
MVGSRVAAGHPGVTRTDCTLYGPAGAVDQSMYTAMGNRSCAGCSSSSSEGMIRNRGSQRRRSHRDLLESKRQVPRFSPCGGAYG